MDKLTELHHGVPVIKGKRFDLAAKKLYEYESKLELGYVLVPLKQILNAAGKAPVPIVFEKPNPILVEPIIFKEPSAFEYLNCYGSNVFPDLRSITIAKFLESRAIKGGGSDE